MKVYNLKTGESFFQKKRRRFDDPGHAHELTFSCFRSFAFLSHDRARSWFLEELRAARRKFAFDLWAYVLMPEHVHLLIHPRSSMVDAGHIMATIKEAVARKAIGYLEANSPQWLSRITVHEGNRTRRRFWQPGGGYDRNAVEIATVHQMIEYIHANPVRRELAACAEDWRWSSAQWYAGIRPVAIGIDESVPRLHEGHRG